ncbi:MAG: hypothetical protein JWN25_388 [Verrucomicrobiales bacterium]|nr:hypothetical protein [Verrucomicrobiales bacterium]MDB6129119.1 hypothetical protein [Verrucomicrobiales bacterium]
MGTKFEQEVLFTDNRCSQILTNVGWFFHPRTRKALEDLRSSLGASEVFVVHLALNARCVRIMDIHSGV